jgi:hypothetical protein
MRVIQAIARFVAPRFAALSLGLLMMLWSPVFGQEKPERFWVAGRYDGDRIVVYFNKVKFGGTMTSKARKIAPPVVDAFFSPVELPENYVAGFQKTGDAEHFGIGDRYDLMLGNGTIATIKLTTLVGCETDEEVGNDSFVGALATAEQPSYLAFTRGYYAVRRHQEAPGDGVWPKPKTAAEYLRFAGLRDEPTRFDVETRIAALLSQRMKIEATDAERRLAGSAAPALRVQPFQVADGSLRYYVRAEWKSGKQTGLQYPYTLAAWITPLPTLRVLAVEKRASAGYAIADGLPDLLNVVDLGAGRTGIIIHVSHGDSTELDLAEYRDGVGTQSMRLMQSLSFGG